MFAVTGQSAVPSERVVGREEAQIQLQSMVGGASGVQTHPIIAS